MVVGHSNSTWLSPYNMYVAGFLRQIDDKRLYCFFNFKNEVSYIDWKTVKGKGNPPVLLFDHWQQKE